MSDLNEGRPKRLQIVGLLAQARKSHRPLVTCNLSEHYQEIFRITRLSDFMTMYSDEQAALAAARAENG